MTSVGRIKILPLYRLKNPHMFKNTFIALAMLCAYVSNAQVVINEIDSDNFSTDEQEFIELKSDVPNFSLNGYILVLYNGSPTSSTGNKSYYAFDLDGIVTDINGLAVIGNSLVTPLPDGYFSTNTIQNGQDAVALYLGNSSDFPDQTNVTATNLIDAVVYGNNNPDATTLMQVLGVSTQINESMNGLGTTQSIQRKNDGTYEVKAPTPGANNDGSGFVFNYVGINTTITEINEGDSFTVNFSTTMPVTENVTFTYSLLNGSFNEADYVANLTITIPAGQSSFDTTITLVDDTLDEGDEVMMIALGTLPAGFKPFNGSRDVRVIDNDFTVATWGTPLNPTYGMVSSTVPDGYYDSLEGLSGDALRQGIQNIIADPNLIRKHTYGDVTDILNQADQNPENSNEVWLMYVEQGRAKYKFQTTASSTGSWNREHIYPQSRGGFANATSSEAFGMDVWEPTNASDLTAGHSDAHHIRAEDGPENSSRGNRDFGDDYNGPANSQGSWHGDVARSLFYMALRYNQLSVVFGNPSDNTAYQLGDLTYLLNWNQQDPSDDFEMNRNNIIYTWQYNRNPFIDYPLLADYIWGANAGQVWSASLSTTTNTGTEFAIYPNPATSILYVGGLQTDATLEIYSVSGQMVFKQNVSGTAAVTIDLPSGLYVAKIASEGQISVKKLLIK